MYCRNEGRSAIVSKSIILSQYNYILNNPEIFTCQENFHGELYCSSERAVYDLMDGIQDLSRVKIDFNSLTHQFIKQAGPFDDVCDCKLSKAFFNAIKVQFESGQERSPCCQSRSLVENSPWQTLRKNQAVDIWMFCQAVH